LQEAAERLGGASWPVFRDEIVSSATGRAKRPGLDALLKGLARRDFDIVAAWSVCRLRRTLSDLIGHSHPIDLYLHQQALTGGTAARHDAMTLTASVAGVVAVPLG
jgi:Resolvase, N terminal domain